MGLLRAVDAVDELRTYLNDQEHYSPPQIRTDLLKLHGLAMAVVNEGSRSQVAELFMLADDLGAQFYQMLEWLEAIKGTLDSLTALCPESVVDDITLLQNGRSVKSLGNL